jgi:hypothetical protein
VTWGTRSFKNSIGIFSENPRQKPKLDFQNFSFLAVFTSLDFSMKIGIFTQKIHQCEHNQSQCENRLKEDSNF